MPKKKLPNLSALLKRVASQTKQTQAEVLAAVDGVVNLLAPGFVFGYFDLDDVRQEGREIALKSLVKYDSTRPLPNYLYTSVKNGFINFKRNNFHRNDPPCQICHRTVGPTTEHENGQFCPNYLSWKKRNGAKANLMQPVSLDQVAEDEQLCDDAAPDQAEMNELLQKIDARLPLELRSTYLQMRAGVSVPKERRLEVEQAVREILAEQDDG